MNYQWFPCPAKINLFLHINGRLPNGYHQLQTYFQLLEYSDLLGIKVAKTNNILQMHNAISGVSDEDNLILKAARLLQKISKSRFGATFSIDKKLPLGGGIGGGSSNAATTLVVLNKLWELNYSNETLMELGKQLGADVPVFVNGYSGFAAGIGEQIYSRKLPEKTYLVAKPDVHISTAEIFKDPDLPRNTATLDFNSYRFEDTGNDCQTLVCKRYPKVAKLLQWLLNYAPSRLTGTGACVFSIFDSESQANDALKQLPKEFTGFVSRSTPKSILHELI